MPWKECHVVDGRARFVARLTDGETMTALCQEFESRSARQREKALRCPAGDFLCLVERPCL